MKIFKDYFVTFLILSILLVALFFSVNFFQTNSANATNSQILDTSKSLEISEDISSNSNNEIPNIDSNEKKLLITGSKLNYESLHSTLNDTEKLNLLNDNKYNLKDRILCYLGDNKSTVGFIYYDLNSHKYIKFNENDIFIAASTYKVKLNVLAYEQNKLDPTFLSKKLNYKNSDYEEGTGVLQNLNEIPPTSINNLLDLSIINSDNIATNMVGSYLGGHDNVRKEISNMFNNSISCDENITTPEIEFKILKYIYDNRNDPNYDHLIKSLKSTDYHDRIDKYIPKDIVAHKVGSSNEYIHDVGIIFSDNPYILIIYSKGLDNPEEKIAQISNAIYNYQVNNPITK